MNDFQERYKIIILLFLIGALILIGNLFAIQILNSNYRSQAQSRTLTKRTISPSRGIITDRDDRLIVVNEPAYELQIILAEVDKKMDVERFCDLLNISIQEYENALDEIQKKPYFRRNLPIRFLNNIEPDRFSIFQEHLHQFSGFYPKVQNKRRYPFSNAAHVLGFLGEVNTEDILTFPEQYEAGDYRGITGFERTYDHLLTGEKGMEFLLRDNLGREIEAYREGALDTMAINGEDLQSTLDINLQAYGELLFSNKRGSIVAIEPSTGEILALVSSPNYDPNQLAIGRQRNKTYLNLLRDTLNQPLFNRALQAKYPPGSIFKPILSLIALQENTTYAKRSMVCTGEYVINARLGYIQKCRNHPAPADISTALQYSCNSYYFQLFREFVDQFGVRSPELGLNAFNQHLADFGLGRTLGIDLPNESTGFIPSPEFYDNIYLPEGAQWRSTYILSLGIGQGEMELTTIQMANLAAIVANRGYYIVPHLIKSMSQSAQFLPFDKHQVRIDSVHFDPVIEGLQRVVDSGTGRRANVPGIAICGKTGTSQNPHGLDHSVFFGFAPRDNPKIAIAVYVENAGGGGAVAAPIGGLMIEQYLHGEISRRRQFWDTYVKELQLIDHP